MPSAATFISAFLLIIAVATAQDNGGQGLECDACGDGQQGCAEGLGCNDNLCIFQHSDAEDHAALERCRSVAAEAENQQPVFGDECAACDEGSPRGCGDGLVCSDHLCVQGGDVAASTLLCRGGSDQCKSAGERCVGAEGHPEVPYGDGCCDPLMCTQEDKSEGGYGLLCQY